MGNIYACRAKRSITSHKSRKMLETNLDRIFSVAKKNFHVTPAIKTDRNMEKYREKMYVDENDAARLEIHVSSHIKGIIDYLESNHNKLADVGRYVSKAVTRSTNPEIHILGLLVLRDLLNEISKFSYDQDLLERLVGSQGRENITTDERRKILRVQNREDEHAPDYTPDIVEYKSDIMGNVMEFEGSVFEVLSFTCDRKRNPLYNSSFKYSLQVLNAYAKKHAGYVSSERIEHILKEVLEIMSCYKDIDNQENLERNHQLLEVMKNLAKIQNIVFLFKFKFIQYTCMILRDLYLDEQKPTDLTNTNSSVEMKTLKKEAKQKAFELFEIIAQSLSDLTEFDVVITPIFSFFDETHWNDEQLQKDIFVSLQSSMKDNTAFDQIEIFMIEKIIEYIDYDKFEFSVSANRYKNNKDPEVKAKVFSVLEVVLEQARRSFLSFLIIDKLMICFVENLIDHTRQNSSKDLRVKQSIYNCQKSFIEKINNSSKSLTQVINCISAQILKRCPEDNPHHTQTTALLKFLDFTISHTHSFPSQTSVPRDSLNALLKLRDNRNILLETFSPIEKLLALTVDSEESPDDRLSLRGLKLAPCETDVGQDLIKNSISTMRALMEERRQTADSQSLKNLRFLIFLCHFAQINQSLFDRKDLTLLTTQLCSLKNIIDLHEEEMQKYQQKKDDQAKQNSMLLTYFCLDFLKNLTRTWDISTLTAQIEAFSSQLPGGVVTVLTSDSQNLKQETSDQIYESLNQSPLINAQWSAEESEGLIDLLLFQFRTILPAFSLEKICKEFHSRDPNDESNVQDDESADIQPTEYRHLPSGKMDFQRQDSEPVKTRGYNRKESMSIFSQVTLQDKILNSLPSAKMTDIIPEKDYSTNSIVDASFRKALDEVHKEKEKPMNLSRILNEEIY